MNHDPLRSRSTSDLHSPFGIEPLETRIAPAVFFLSGAGLTIENAAGGDANDAAKAAQAVMDRALVLRAGDSLVMDFDGDNVLDGFNATTPGAPIDFLLAKVTGGAAVVFFEDFDGDGNFEPDELGGLSVSDGFKASIFTDLRGDVATTYVAATDSFTPGAPNFASIAGLTVTGRIQGDVFAGRNLTNLTIGNGLYSAGLSANIISTGTNLDGVGVKYGGAFFPMTFEQPAGVAGGNIAKVKLANGAASIRAGFGGDNPSGNAGAGGSISDLTIAAGVFLTFVLAGDGGDATGPTGNGGAGGSLTKLDVAGVENVQFLLAGDGGEAGIIGKGGAGGSISTARVVADVSTLTVAAGDGGGGRGAANAGGAGGNLTGVTIIAADLADLAISAGRGGDGLLSNARGGAGGAVSKLSVTAAEVTSAFVLSAGIGGNGQGTGAGGKGGAISSTVVKLGPDTGSVEVAAGNGGTGAVGGDGGALSGLDLAASGVANNVTILAGAGGDAPLGGRSGAGGALTKSVFHLVDVGGIDIRSGSGGEGGAGGRGGNLTTSSLTLDGSLGSNIFFFAGNAGDSSDAGGAKGGSVQGVNVTNFGDADFITVQSGRGSIVSAGSGDGGDGGALSAVTLRNFGTMTFAGRLFAGDGGDGSGVGDGGEGGAVAKATVENHAIGQSFVVRGGAGASAGAVSGDGGSSGAVSTVVVRDLTGVSGVNAIRTQNAGAGAGPSGRGGHVGAISNIVLDGITAAFELSGPTNAGNGNAAGGHGGSISKITGRVGTLEIEAANGGDSAAGAGGHGGAVSGVKLSAVGEFVRRIYAGSGGDGATTAGLGGSISALVVPGDIGDFGDDFDLTGVAGMGGLSAGRGGDAPTPGRNGSVLNVTADRIAAILAGRPAANAIGADNAVDALSGLKTFALGADVDSDETFDFTNNVPPAAFTTGDTALDGLVVVRAAGLAPLPIAPLFLIAV